MSLMLTRKKGQSIVCDSDVVVEVASIRGDRVRLKIDAPPAIKVMRGELINKIIGEAIAATNNARSAIDDADQPTIIDRTLRDGRRAQAYVGSDGNLYLAIEGQRIKALNLAYLIDTLASA